MPDGPRRQTLSRLGLCLLGGALPVAYVAAGRLVMSLFGDYGMVAILALLVVTAVAWLWLRDQFDLTFSARASPWSVTQSFGWGSGAVFVVIAVAAAVAYWAQGFPPI